MGGTLSLHFHLISLAVMGDSRSRNGKPGTPVDAILRSPSLMLCGRRRSAVETSLRAGKANFGFLRQSYA
jgi:hypothetical protein